MGRSVRRAFVAIGLLPVIVWAAGPVLADAPPDANAPRPALPPIDASLLGQKGPVDVVLRLRKPSLAETVAPNATNLGTLPAASAQRATADAAESQQRTVAHAATWLGPTELGSVSKSLNAVVVHADASAVTKLASIPGVTQVTRVPDFEMSWP